MIFFFFVENILKWNSSIQRNGIFSTIYRDSTPLLIDPFYKHERASADAGGGDRITRILGDHTQPVIHQLQGQVGKGRVQRDLNGHVVQRLDRFDHRDGGPGGAVHLGVQHAIKRIEHVGGFHHRRVLDARRDEASAAGRSENPEQRGVVRLRPAGGEHDQARAISWGTAG